METREHILAVAQRLVQQRGFNGFSYADVAAEVGIRSASLHHHFPSKADLGVALIDSYVSAFGDALARIADLNVHDDVKLAEYAALYKKTLEADRMCLCGILATEAVTLDPAMLPQLKRFFSRQAEWLTEVLASGKAKKRFGFEGSAADHARMYLSTLQGALLIARSTGDREAFEQTIGLLTAKLTRKG